MQGFPFEGFHIEDVMLPEDDDLGIPSDDEEEGEEEIQTETGFGCVVGACQSSFDVRSCMMKDRKTMYV